MDDTVKALRAELEALRAELDGLRAWRDGHVCQTAPACTCPHPTAAAPSAPVPCPVHGPGVSTTWISPYHTYWQSTAAAAPCPSSYTLTVNTGANLVPFQMPSSVAAGGAAQTFMLIATGECE